MLFKREVARMDSYCENEDDGDESGVMAPVTSGAMLAEELSAGVGYDESAEDRVLRLLKRKSYLLYRLQKVKCKQARQSLARKQSVASFGHEQQRAGLTRKQSMTSIGAQQGAGAGAAGGGMRFSSAASGASRPDLHKSPSAAQLQPPGFHRVVTESGIFHTPMSPAKMFPSPSSAAGGSTAFQNLRGPVPPSNLHMALAGFKQQQREEDRERYDKYPYSLRKQVQLPK